MLEQEKKSKGKFICFEGIDGAGKTTIAQKLAKHLASERTKAIFVDKKSADFSTEYVTERMQIVRDLIWDYPPDAPIQELGDEHWLYLMASWFSILDRCKVRPLIEKGYTVITDNWYYKFIARFMIKTNVDSTHVRNCFSSFLHPDITIFLDVRPEVAALRKREFTLTEAGNMDGLSGRTEENFVTYQETVRQALLKLCQQEKWLVISVDDLSQEQVLKEVLSVLPFR